LLEIDLFEQPDAYGCSLLWTDKIVSVISPQANYYLRLLLSKAGRNLSFRPRFTGEVCGATLQK
jgi:hypothetical protein